MAKLLIDLSGRGGLGDKFFGDSDQITPTPNKRYLLSEGEMASGTFNPFTRDGYLSPSTNVFHPVTTEYDLSGVLGSSVYDPINDDYYFAERSGSQLFKGDGLSDTSLTRVGNVAPTATLTTTLGSSVAWMSTAILVRPSDEAYPEYVNSVRETSASGTTVTKSITVSSGTNRGLLVVALNYTSTSAASATYNGTAMTLIGVGNSGSKSVAYFYTAAPAVTTANIVVTWGSSQTNLVVYGYVFTGVNQTTPFSTLSINSGTGTSATVTAISTSNYQMVVQSTLSATATHSLMGGVNSVFNTTNTSGNDSSGYASFLNYTILDLEIYQINGVRKLFYIYTYSTTIQVGIATLPFSSNDDDWLSSAPVGAFSNTTTSNYNFMRTADNGFAYLFNDNQVHKIDGTTLGGTNGTVSANVLLFPTFFRLSDAVDYRGNIYMVIHQNTTDSTSRTQTNYATPCGVYIWDRLTTQVRMSDYIPVEGVRVIKKIYIAPSGGIRIICVSSDGITQIREFTGSVFSVVKELGIGAAPQYADSLVVSGTKTMWLAPDGSLYCHGQTRPKGPEILARIAQVRAPQAETTTGYSENITAGALLYGYGTDSATAGYRSDRQGITLSYSTGTPVVKKIFPFDVDTINATAQTSHVGDIYTGVIPLPFMSTVHTINLYMAKGTTTGSTVQATVKIYFNGSATADMSKSITRDDIAKGYFNIKVNKPYVHSMQIEIEYATGITMSDAYDFHPYYADVNYEATAVLAQA